MSALAGRSVSVKVPATTANLGPGLDTLGLALALYDNLEVTVRDEPGAFVEVHGIGEGGDHIGAGVERLENVGAGRLKSAHELHDDVGAVDQRLGVGRDQFRGDLGRANSVRVANRHADQLESGTSAAGEFFAVLKQQCGDLRANTSAAEQCHLEIAVFDHGVGSNPASLERRSASVSPRTMTRATPSRTATTGGRPR